MNNPKRYKKDRKRRLQYRKKQDRMREYGTWIKSTCPECGTERLFYYYRYDAECCITCDIWQNKPCSDPDCAYCSMRPETPSKALAIEESLRFEDDWIREGDKKGWRQRNYQHKNDGKMRHMRKKEYYDNLHDDFEKF